MTTAAEILYSEAGPFERALAAALSDVLPIPLRDILDPSRAPVPFLPFNAARESVDLWFDDWPEARKRLMVLAARNGLAEMKGTEAALPAFLAFVDAVIVDRVAHPRRFVIGRSALGLQPIGHKPFTTHLLVKVPLRRPAHGFVIGRSAIGRGALRTPDREPLRRLARAIVVSKAPETLISFNTGHRRPVTVEDGAVLDGSTVMGGYIDRKRL